ncbi:MAG: hypothetical protein K8T90_17090 [Planctomycetes bacterium]|nr:hypothetical protein [Planctomycetota bacterium]
MRLMRTWMLVMLRKGGRGTSVSVARRALRDHETPDGVELARQVLSSFRLGR